MSPVPISHSAASKECSIVLDHWQRLRSDGFVPKRAKLDPGAIGAALPFILLLEILSPAESRVRLAGTGLRDLFGFEPRGCNYIELVPPQERRLWGDRLWQLIHQPCGAEFSGTVLFPSGASLFCHGLLLPLANDRPGQPPLAIAVEAPLLGQSWFLAPRTTDLDQGEGFSFLDIGAGTPDIAMPAAWAPGGR